MFVFSLASKFKVLLMHAEWEKILEQNYFWVKIGNLFTKHVFLVISRYIRIQCFNLYGHPVYQNLDILAHNGLEHNV